MRVRIIDSPKGNVEGIDVNLLRVGAIYDLSLPLAGLLLLEGWAVPEQRMKDRAGSLVFFHFPTQLLDAHPKLT
jgi:hypothetical protein